MMFLVTLFSSGAGSVDAVGTWRVTADTPDQAIVVARSRANSRLWPPDSGWMVIPVPGDQAKRRANSRRSVSGASVRRSRQKAEC
jgi:hypothetical protein